tara:strand:+ start:352 stop:726 length:375 start_codon:yes stop_codon:yes gene_type:complete
MFNKWYTVNTETIDLDKNIGNISILEYPTYEEFQRWIKIDSQYIRVNSARRYFENFTSDDFFSKEINKNKFKEITWLKMAEYQKRYSELTDLYKDYETAYIDSLIFTEYPQIKELLDDIFKLNY